MRYQRLLGLLALLVLLFFALDPQTYGQRRGGGGGAGRAGGAAGGYRGGSVVGPYGGSASGARSGGAVVGPAGRSASSGSRGGSYTTPGGSTIQGGAAGRKVSGPAGGTAGRAVGGVKVTTPGGKTAAKVGSAGGVIGPGGTGAARGGSVGAATGPRGTVAGASRSGVVGGPYGMAGYTARGKVAVGHGTRYVAAGTIRTQGVYVRNNFAHYNCFNRAWYTAHPNAWRAAAWTAATFWTGAAWGRLSPFCGYAAVPANYDYGSSVVYQDNRVYIDGTEVDTAEEYADQANDIAVKGQQAPVTEKEEWLPLGVFGMVQGEEKDANDVFQLAVNKEGVIRGNFYSALSDSTLPVYGSVDKKTERAAWIVGDRKDTVFETGIGNLTEPQTKLLVHFGKNRTQQWTLVRLEQPSEEK